MADIEVVDLSKARRVPIKQKDFVLQIQEQLRQDAHKQKSHREFDEYLSKNQSTYIITTMLQALQDEPQNPFQAMSDRLRAPNEGHNLTIIGSDISEMMRKDPFFSQVHPDVFNDVYQKAEETEYKAGQEIFKKGARADAIALITAGSVRVGQNIVMRGHFIAMNALFENSTYQCDVTAETDCKLVVLDRNVINNDILNTSIKQTYTRGNFYQEILRQKFPQLTQSEILLLSQLAKPVVYEDKQVIAEKNDQLNYFLVVTQVFNQQAIDSVVDQMHSNIDEHIIFQERPIPRQDEAAVTVGDIIGLEGVLIGQEERRDWLCNGIVEGYVIEADDLKIRGELMRKLKESVQ